MDTLCVRLRKGAQVSSGRGDAGESPEFLFVRPLGQPPACIIAERRPSPSAAVIDTQSVDTEQQAGTGRDRDPSKKVKGRRRHVIIDTLGLLLAVVVHPANQHDSQAAPSVLKQLLGKVPRLKVVFTDSG